MFRFKVFSVSYWLCGSLFLTASGHGGDFVVHQTLFVVGKGRHLVVNQIQFRGCQMETKVLATILEGVAATVFAQHQTAFRHTYRLRIDDLIRGGLFQESILMDTGFVSEGVGAYD